MIDLEDLSPANTTPARSTPVACQHTREPSPASTSPTMALWTPAVLPAWHDLLPTSKSRERPRQAHPVQREHPRFAREQPALHGDARASQRALGPPEHVLFAMLSNSKPSHDAPPAGICSYLNTSTANLSTEVGALISFARSGTQMPR